jgi:hypothetical protein
MQALQAVWLVAKAATLRSAQLPRPTEVVAVVQALVPLLQVSVDAVVASAPKVRPHPTEALMALAAAATAALLRVSTP